MVVLRHRSRSPCSSRRFRIASLPLGPILLATRSAAWARLGPLSRSAVSCEQRLRQTVDRDRIRRDRSPNGVAWRFPDWTAVGFAFPGPVPRIGHPHSPVTRVLLLSWTRWFDGTADSLRAAPTITCGDDNPGCQSSVFHAH
jgi:hypothetical protein